MGAGIGILSISLSKSNLLAGFWIGGGGCDGAAGVGLTAGMVAGAVFCDVGVAGATVFPYTVLPYPYET